ncbi:NADH-quinone oxidoreductase subunit C [Hufsiella ginkgonis]|uniref:NADH-quinone oxidoreductase subunit C n=1 Tax=Hufsiella ginkgonis TaxID=2695274 RepID=A0A7K1XWS2_9SPHI|nr:NADH-quinone oxidoreductase subunit C [Hufsiella ginkgonis]MXV15454.1 NADH-quinone oxidoreductase subunit C [Hufsiella ginkgonis]
MNFNDVKVLIEERFGPDAILGTEETGLQPALLVQPDRIAGICTELRDNPATYFDFLACLTGVDHGADERAFSVVYHLSSIPYNTQLVLKVKKQVNETSGEMPFFDTVSPVWKTAEWHEREAFDLLGIYFTGHPDLRRILLPDDWEGHPLRKDYETAEYYNGIKIDF